VEEPINVLVLVDFSDAIMEQFKAVSPRLKFTKKAVKSASEISGEQWATVDILYTGGILPDPDAAPRLRWIQTHSAGVDNVLGQPLLAEEDIIITTTSGIHATTMAEYTFGMLLALARKIPTMLRHQQKSEWSSERFSLFLPRELRGATLGILGYGSIGREIARLAQAFGMEVLATKRNVMNPAAVNEYTQPGIGDPEGIIVSRLYPPEAAKSMVSLCDFVVVTIPATPGTKGTIDDEFLAAMKKTAYLVNIGRGSVVDEEALVKALQTGQIAGAALDVFVQEPLPSASPLWKLENVIISPHIAGNHANYNEASADVFTQNLERYLNKRDLLNLVDRRLGY